MRVAYFTNNYPGHSHTFIRREIQAIEASGTIVFRYALRPARSVIDRDDKEEATRTHYIVSSTSEMLRCCIVVLVTRPLGIIRAVRQAVKIGWRSDRGLLRHFLYVAEAAILAYWCRRNAIDHLHAHFGTNSAAIAMFAWRISGIPYSFTVHGPEEFDKWPFIGLAEKIRNSKFTVAISSYGLSQLYRCVEPKYWKKIAVVHCGLESAVFSTAKTPTSTMRRFVCVGRLSEQKGHLLLVEAARRLASAGADFEIVLVGDGEMRGEIETLIKQYDLQDKIRITGWIDARQVWSELSSARALVLPSFAEGLPVVIMEAMALKRPVISTYVAGIPELVQPGEHGWLVPAGDISALVEAMQACLDTSDETLLRMGDAAQERVMSRHSADTEAAKLVALFETVDPQQSKEVSAK